MYQFNNRLPAPYEINPQPQPQALARGGYTKKPHHKMVVAHFNPHELSVLDHLQGKEERCPRSGIRTYTHLEELLKNPHIVNNVHHHARKHRAEGGLSQHMEHLAEGGQHGDTELAMIGPHTHHLLNQIAGHPTRNPHTGYPEYWSIGEALGGLWNGIKGAAGHVWDGIKGIGRAALPALAEAGGKALGNKYLGDVGGQLAGRFLPQLAQSVVGEEQNPYYRSIGQGLGEGAKAYQGGASAREALGKGMEHTGNQFGSGIVGSAMQGVGQNLSGKNPSVLGASLGALNNITTNNGGLRNAFNGMGSEGRGLAPDFKQSKIPNVPRFPNPNSPYITRNKIRALGFG